MPTLRLQKLLLVMAINEEYPILEYMIVGPLTKEDPVLMLPETLQAPHLHHLALYGFPFPTGSQLLTTAVGLITLSLHNNTIHRLRPTILLHWLSSMLETLEIGFSHPVPNCDVERQLIYTSITTQVTLPNLRQFISQGVFRKRLFVGPPPVASRSSEFSSSSNLLFPSYVSYSL